MVTDVNLKDIQRKIYMAYFQDGLWDILLGSFLVIWGIGILTQTAALAGVWFCAAYLAVLAVKKRITYPRIGQAKIPQERRTLVGLVIAGVVILFAGVLAFLLFNWDTTPKVPGIYFVFIFGIVLAVPITLVGYWWKVNHWYGYAALILIGIAFHHWFKVSLALCFIIPGVIVLICGIAMLVRFLRRNPRLAAEAPDEAK